MNERLPPPGYYDQFDGYVMYRSGDASFSMTPSGWTINAPTLTIQDRGEFVPWVKERLAETPRHSGYDTPGIERAIAYLESLNEQISKTMRLDLEGEINASEISEVRTQIETGISKLRERFNKVNKHTEVEGYTDGYSSKNTKQMNIKMTEEDAKDIAEINQLFFEGEAPNSMLGRILLRKGIQFYKKMKANL